jgi:outer membrane immunogenic protein
MKRWLFRGVVLATLVIANSASAADLGGLSPTVGPLKPNFKVPIYDWTGFYVGVNGGGSWGESRQDHVLNPSMTTGDFPGAGWLAGGTIGFNAQIDQVVYSLEGDLDWARFKGSSACGLDVLSCTTQSDYLGTVRARLGYVWADRWLPYMTGGAAFGDIIQGFSPAVGTNSGTTSNRVGWTVGGGIQVGLAGPWPGKWSIKMEYLYVDLGTFSCTIACSGIAGQITNTTLTEEVARVGVDYRF